MRLVPPDFTNRAGEPSLKPPTELGTPSRKTAQFTRYTISYNGTAGAGTQFVVTDIDGDGDQDVLVAGKTGVHWLESLQVDKVPHEAREKELLLNTDWPFPDEGIKPKD